MSQPQCVTVDGVKRPLMTSAKQPAKECCCGGIPCKKITTYLDKYGFVGFLGGDTYHSAYYQDSGGDPCPGGGSFWHYDLGVDPKTGILTGSYCGSGAFYGRQAAGNPGWDPGFTDSYGEINYSDPSKEDYQGSLSSVYSDAELIGYVDALLAGGDLTSVGDGETWISSYDSGGSVVLNSGGGSCDFTAFYYKDSGGTWATKSKFSFVAWADSYCKVETPDGGSPTYTTVPCTIGDTITIDPPSAPGTIEVLLTECPP